MAEPTSASTLSVVGLGVALFGATLGPYAAIVMGALAGGMYAISRTDVGGNKTAAALLLLRIVIVAVVMSGAALWGLSVAFGWDSPHLVSVVAFLIGLFYDRWPVWAETVIEGFVARKAAGPKPGAGNDGQ